ncbi:TPA: DNA (cytosine-5-)-methyltransferase [Legionella pneumophila]|uniref:Cytosine-specific methyltransferase n=1 Tax=Legionella pneumophila TaxID=446 RepID=A0AAN5KTB0_LEGPN|nr:DNA (cytosine-5-)-methyltransferase [Legionella pneumophila]
MKTTIIKLNHLYTLLGEDQLTEKLEITPKTLRSWLKDESIPKQSLVSARLDQIFTDITSPPVTGKGFTFIDLFAGIGGIRLGFEEIGGECIFTSEWDRYSQKTYRANFNDHHPVVGDITKVDTDLIPDHDVLLAGFPCQPFSLAGVSKKNSLGRAHGFECNTQGTLFFDVERIIAAKKPKAFLLENVKNLKSHDGGKTFAVIMETLKKKLGYHVHTMIIDANGFVPQHRERIFIVGFKENMPFSWDKLNRPARGTVLMKDILHPEDGSETAEPPYTAGKKAIVNKDFILTDRLWNYLQAYKEKHEAKGNGFGFGLTTGEDTARTLSARYHKDGSEILIHRGKNKNPRRLTPRECARLMGYPDSFVIPVSNTQAYRQFGNSVVVPVIQEIAKIMKPHIQEMTSRKTAISEPLPEAMCRTA